jgi:hypothetical protein
MPTAVIPLEHQLRCAQRELRLRRQVYPKLVDERRMTQKAADHEIALMQAIVHTLEEVLESQQLSLFPRAGEERI